MPLLEVENLKVGFQTSKGRIQAVDGVSFNLEEGKTLGIVGESGSGKTATALALMRLLQEPPAIFESERMTFRGQNLLNLNRNDWGRIRGSQISMIFQEPMTSLNPVFTVGDQIQEAIILHQKVSRSEALKRCLEIMETVGIPDVEERIDYYPHQLSGGLRQRVMIAIALSCRPRLLIADEPTTALDVTIQAQILKLIKSLQAKFGMSMILITHDFGVIAETSDEVAVMYAGRIIEKSSVEDIFDRPEHPYTLGLQRSIPKFGGSRDALYTIQGVVPDLSKLSKGCRFVERCEYKQPKCFESEPALESRSKNHSTACYFPRDHT